MHRSLQHSTEEVLSPAQILSAFCIAQVNDFHGALPPLLYHNCSKALWLIQITICISPEFRKNLIDRCNDEIVSLLLKFLGKLFTSKQQRWKAAPVVVEKLERFYRYSVSISLNLNEWPDSFFYAAVFLHILAPSIEHFPLRQRSFRNEEFNNLKADTLLLTVSSKDSLRNKKTLPLIFQVGSRTFELLLVGRENYKGSSIVLFRYGRKHSGFWLCTKQKGFVRKIEETPQECMDTFIQGYWNLALFRVVAHPNVNTLRMDFLSNFSCQGLFFCSTHSTKTTVFKPDDYTH